MWHAFAYQSQTISQTQTHRLLSAIILSIHREITLIVFYIHGTGLSYWQIFFLGVNTVVSVFNGLK